MIPTDTQRSSVCANCPGDEPKVCVQLAYCRVPAAARDCESIVAALLRRGVTLSLTGFRRLLAAMRR